MTIKTTTNASDLDQIIALQQQNLRANISAAEALEQGFLHVQHTPELLRTICGAYGHVVAKDQERLAGYNLMMLTDARESIPKLRPMFKRFDQLTFGGQDLKTLHYCVCGQVCVAKPYRGQGLLKKMYQAVRTQAQQDFDLLVTEVATVNKRSLNAHAKVGFQIIDHYTDPEGIEWEIVVWNWRD